MGKPPLNEESGVTPDGERPELKHLSKGRKINQRDSVSKRRAKAEKPKPCTVTCTWCCGADDMREIKVIELFGMTDQRT